MPDWLIRLQEDIKRLWSQLTAGQKWLVGGLTSALLLGLLGISLAAYFLPGGDFLYGGLDDAEVGELSRFLDEKGARYNIRDGAVYVFGDRDKLRAEFAISNRQKPLGGYGILKEYNWSQTSAQFRETRLRALQEELESTVEKGSDLIDWARVQLTEREKGLFPSGDTKPTASVKVGTRGQTLPKESVQGIQWTVANALPGLKPADVIVTDENSRVLSGYREKSETELLTDEQRKSEELLRERRIKACANILDPIVGGGANYTIAADVKLNFDKKAIKEKYIDAENPFEKRRRTEEIEDKTNQPGGIPGTPSNNPDDNIGPDSSSHASNSSMTQETQEVDNEPRLVRETSTEVAPGELETQWISIAVNYVPTIENGEKKYVQRTPEQMAELEKSLKLAAAHIENSTRHHFVLNQVQFDRSGEILAETEARWETIRTNVESAAFLAAALISILVFFYFLRKVFSIKPAEEELVRSEEISLPGPRMPEPSQREFGLRSIGDLENLPPEEQKSRIIREEIENYAKGKPEDFVGILRNWLAE
ncbi:MAG: hypothetical protein AMXMBFR75_23600 [Candidatus Hinthialibacteria bacterium]